MLECEQNSTVTENLFELQQGYLTPDLILRAIQLKIYKIMIDDDDDDNNSNNNSNRNGIVLILYYY